MGFRTLSDVDAVSPPTPRQIRLLELAVNDVPEDTDRGVEVLDLVDLVQDGTEDERGVLNRAVQDEISCKVST